jgi:hypothetical protein
MGTYTRPPVIIESWSDFRDLAEGNDYRSWAFRGQRDASWSLDTSIARYFTQFSVHKKAWRSQEERALRIFRRKAHLFLGHVPRADDSFEWLALMQHHGARTRLLDLTWSPYVAAFFALEEATSDAAVWAFCCPKIAVPGEITLATGTKLRPSDRSLRTLEMFEKHYLPGTEPLVYIGEPSIMNKRLVAQSGTFAVPGRIDAPLESILADYPDVPLVKWVLRTKELRRDAMRELYNMNLTNATLFPDLTGLARSMAYELEFHWAFDPVTTSPTPGFPPPDGYLT